MQQQLFKVRDKRNKGWFFIDNEYLNGYAKILGPVATSIYLSLCRHSDNNQECFPSMKLIAEELGVSKITIKRHIKKLKEYNIISIKQEKDTNGKFLNNLYILMDKDVWIKPRYQKDTTVSRGIKLSPAVVSNCYHKDTNINNTNILSKDNRENPVSSKKEYGNGEINTLLKELKDLSGLSLLDGSDKENRRYCWLAIKKFGGADKVREIIGLATDDNFHLKNLTGFRYIYYNGVKILGSKKVGEEAIIPSYAKGWAKKDDKK